MYTLSYCHARLERQRNHSNITLAAEATEQQINFLYTIFSDGVTIPKMAQNRCFCHSSRLAGLISEIVSDGL